MRGSRTGIALLLVATIAGCGSGGDTQPGLTAGQKQALTAQLEAARAAAAARDTEGTKAALVSFRRSVARLQRDGALSAATARALRIGAQRVVKRVASDNAPPPQLTPGGAPATSTSTATTPAPAPGQKKKHEKKHGKDKKGEGDGEGDG